MSHCHQVYGLNLVVNVALPGCIPTTCQNQRSIVEITMGHLPSWLIQKPQDLGIAPNYYTAPKQFDGEDVHTLQVWQVNNGQHYYCSYKDGTNFVVNRLGTEVWAEWPENLTLEDTTTYLLGPILGFVLRLQGIVCLHASAIVIQGHAVVMLGTTGAGKSTTAAAFAKCNYPILSDDVVTLCDRGDTFLVQPAYPYIRLWDSSVEALYGTPDALPRIVPTHPTWDKRYLDLTQSDYQFQQKPLPLAAIYYLNARSDESTCPHIDTMSGPAQLITLVSNTYTNYLLDKRQRAQEFEVLNRLLKHVPVRQITPHLDVARLPQLLTTIIEDFQKILTSQPIVTHA